MIRLNNVYKSYGAIKVIEDFSMVMELGTSLCLVGPSGCGKSTLLKLIALITMPDRGSIFFNELDLTGMSPSMLDEFRSRSIAYSFQEPLLIPSLNAVENITDVVNSSRDKAIEMLREFELGDRLSHRPGKMSVGEKKRVDIARALLKGSPVLIADEPLSNLDPSIGEKVMRKLKEHTTKGGILVYSSVNLSDSRYADMTIQMVKAA